MYPPVGSYRRDFTTPAEWVGKEIFVSFQGVESAFYLWVNGQYVGYSEDSYTPSEFDISPYLNAPGEQNNISVQVYRWSDGSYLEDQDFIRLSGIFRDTPSEFDISPYLNAPGEQNNISVQVYRWSDGSYLEDQDFIRLSGIFRDVFLFCKDKNASIFDFNYTTDLDEEYNNAVLNVLEDQDFIRLSGIFRDVFLFCKDKNASIFDFNYTTDLDEEYNNAVLNVETTLRRYNEEGSAEGYTVDATLFDAEGNEVFTQSMTPAFEGKEAAAQISVDVEASEMYFYSAKTKMLLFLTLTTQRIWMKNITMQFLM